MAGLTCDDVRETAAAYVLGALEPAEAQAMAEHLADCPETHEELAELGGVVPYLVETVDLVEPSADLRGRVMAAAAADLVARGGAPAASGSAPVAAAGDGSALGVAGAAPESIDQLRERAAPRATPASSPAAAGQAVSTEPIPIRPSRRVGVRPRWLVGIAAVLAIVLLGAWNISLQRDLSKAQDYQARVTELLALARTPGTRVAVLTDSAAGTNAPPNGLAVMPPDQPGRLVVTGLAPTSGQQSYVAWAIVPGQAPVAIGSFTVGSDGVGYYNQMPAAPPISLTVAVTLEPVSTVTAPSGPIVSSGVVPAEA